MISITSHGREAAVNRWGFEVWMDRLVREIEASKDRPEWADDLLEDLRDRAYLGLGYDMAVDRLIVGPPIRDLLLINSDRALAKITALEDFGREEMVEAGIGGPGVIPPTSLPAEFVAEIGRQFVAMVGVGHAVEPTVAIGRVS